MRERKKMNITLNDKLGENIVDALLEKLMADGVIPDSKSNITEDYRSELAQLVLERLQD
jgi:hypothetical protein